MLLLVLAGIDAWRLHYIRQSKWHLNFVQMHVSKRAAVTYMVLAAEAFLLDILSSLVLQMPAVYIITS